MSQKIRDCSVSSVLFALTIKMSINLFRTPVHVWLRKDKGIPIQASTGPYGCRRLKHPALLASRHTKVVRVSGLRTDLLYPPEITPGTHFCCGPGSSVGIATELCAGPSGIESRWRRDFPPVQTGPGAHPASCKMGTGSFPGVKCGRDVLLTTHPLLVPRSWKSRAIPLPTLWATPGL